MKTYYLTTRDAFDACHHMFVESSFIDGPGGTVLVAGTFRSQDDETRFSSQPQVHPLPHALSGLTIASLPAAAQTALASFAGIVPTDTVFQAAVKLAAVHPGMKIT